MDFFTRRIGGTISSSSPSAAGGSSSPSGTTSSSIPPLNYPIHPKATSTSPSSSFPEVAVDKAALDAEEAELQLPPALIKKEGEEPAMKEEEDADRTVVIADLRKQLEVATSTAHRMKRLGEVYRTKLYKGHRYCLSQDQRLVQLQESVTSLSQSLERLREAHAKEVLELEAKLVEAEDEPQDAEERKRYVTDLERELDQWRKLGDTGASHMIQPVKKVAVTDEEEAIPQPPSTTAAATNAIAEAAGSTSQQESSGAAEGAAVHSSGGIVAATASAASLKADKEAIELLTAEVAQLETSKANLEEKLTTLAEQLRRCDQERTEALERASALELQTNEQNSNIDRLYDDSTAHQERARILEREVNEISNHEVELQGQVVSLERKEASLREQLETATAKLQSEQSVKTRLQKELAEKGEALRKVTLSAAKGATTPISPHAAASSAPSPAQLPPLPTNHSISINDNIITASDTVSHHINAGAGLLKALAARRKLYASSISQKRALLIVFIMIVTSFYFFTTMAVFGGHGNLSAGGAGGSDTEPAPKWALDAISLCERRIKSLQVIPPQEVH